MRRRRFLLIALTGLLAPTSLRAQGPGKAIDRLRTGGLNIYFRHSLTVRANQPDDDLTSCAGQRNLTEAGVALARDIGRQIRGLRVPIGEVLASPYCRCVDTARWAFGRVAVADWLETNGDPRDEPERRRLAALKDKLAARPPVGSNRVLVAHGNNLNGLTRLYDWPRLPIEEAEAVVFEPATAAVPPTVARIRGTEWRNLAAG